MGVEIGHRRHRGPRADLLEVVLPTPALLVVDDVHFMDGIMHLDSWEMSMDLDNSRPGAPDMPCRSVLTIRLPMRLTLWTGRPVNASSGGSTLRSTNGLRT